MILAAVNSIAEPFGHAATQAPHPMHAALSNALSDSIFGAGTECASVCPKQIPLESIAQLNRDLMKSLFRREGK